MITGWGRRAHSVHVNLYVALYVHKPPLLTAVQCHGCNAVCVDKGLTNYIRLDTCFVNRASCHASVSVLAAAVFAQQS